MLKYKYLIILFCIFKGTFAKTQDFKYNLQYKLACHNCYENENSNDILTVLLYTKILEIDIYDYAMEVDNITSKNEDWYVRHLPPGSNDNCCGGFFSDCLKRIKNWSDLHPNHPVITIFIDKKTNWQKSENRGGKDLDNLLISIFTKDKIFSPYNLSNECDLRNAAKINNWPVVDSLTGKIIFFITDGTLSGGNKILNDYITETSCKSVCFVAPEVRNEKEIDSTNGIATENLNYIIAYNIEYAQKNLTTEISKKNFLCRVWGVPKEDIETLQNLIQMKTNFIAFDDYTIGYQ